MNNTTKVTESIGGRRSTWKKLCTNLILSRLTRRFLRQLYRIIHAIRTRMRIRLSMEDINRGGDIVRSAGCVKGPMQKKRNREGGHGARPLGK